MIAIRAKQWRVTIAIALFFPPLHALAATEFYVSPGGDDTHLGTRQAPFASVGRAQAAVRGLSTRTEPIHIYLSGGIYYLPETLVFEADDSGTQQAPITYMVVSGEEPVLSGGLRLQLTWSMFRDGIVQAKVPADFVADQLFVNGQRQHMARYPNFDPSVRHFNGYVSDAIDARRVARWADPAGGYLHAMHRNEWGDFHYLIAGKNTDGTLAYEGGWQNNRQMGMHNRYRFVENIFEELDAPGEWFHDAKADTLYFLPPQDVDMNTAM